MQMRNAALTMSLWVRLREPTSRYRSCTFVTPDLRRENLSLVGRTRNRTNLLKLVVPSDTHHTMARKLLRLTCHQALDNCSLSIAKLPLSGADIRLAVVLLLSRYTLRHLDRIESVSG